MTMLLVIQAPELFVETVLGLDGNGDDIGRLPLTSSSENEICTTAVAVVPSGLDEDATAVGIARFGNGTAPLALTTGSFGRDEAEVSHKGRRRGETANVTDLGEQRYGREGLDTAQATEGFDVCSVRWRLGVAGDLVVEGTALSLEILEMFEFSSERGSHGAIELISGPGEPSAMGLGPGRLAFGENEAVVAQHT
jgi:hypothetical protein